MTDEAFAGKVALVTGGASGIGRAVVERLARAGASVVVADVDGDAGAAVASSTGSTFVPTDVRDPEQLAAAVEGAVDGYGGLDLVHLNAGVPTGEASLEDLTPDLYRRAVGVNVDGVVFGARAAAPKMRPGGAIVVTASLAGLVPYPGDFVYGITKHAVVGFVRSVAPQLVKRQITVNALCPGFVDTPILGPFAEEFRARGFPLLDPSEVAEAFVTVVRSGQTGEVFVCQPGRLCEAYRFRGVPGPRAPGAEGMAPPLHPGP
ncbi:MAG TPA: SDR family NAD(P)-dependent oxidoreductase [Actinomycetota bacterium]|jgi:NAD(P)-dependent dehydrogenase (short-subunit alcohol dehydrogenase family)